MSLTSTHRDIENALKGTNRFSQVGIWLGDVQALIDAPKAVPAAFVILSGVEYEEPKTLKPVAAIGDTLWSIVLFEYVNNLPDTGEVAVYQAIEATVAAITNIKVGSNRRLWPFRARILGAVKNSVASYGIQFSLI